MTPNEYSFTDPEVAKEIYAISSSYIKSPFYSAFGDPNAKNKNLFANRDPKQHQQDRRQVASMYSLTSLISYEPYVDTCVELLLAKFRESADQRQTFNLMDWMQYYAFDVIGEITFGKSFGMMKDGHDASGILENIHLLAIIPAHLGLISELINPFYFLAGRLAKRTPDFALYEKVSAAITARKSGEESANRDDFLAKGLKLLESGKMEDRNVLGTMMGNVVAGSDTTGITLAAILYHLIRNPSAMQKLQREFDDATTQGTLSTPALFNEAIKLPYFQAVIKESLRMHPAVGMLLGRVIPEGGRQLGGHFFPAGVSFCASK
jgi:cytochrome P450